MIPNFVEWCKIKEATQPVQPAQAGAKPGAQPVAPAAAAKPGAQPVAPAAAAKPGAQPVAPAAAKPGAAPLVQPAAKPGAQPAAPAPGQVIQQAAMKGKVKKMIGGGKKESIDHIHGMIDTLLHGGR